MRLTKSEFPLDNDKPCPFCANTDIVCGEEDLGEGWACWCNNCGAIGPNDLVWSGAIEMWNLRRKNYDKLADENIKLLDAIKDLEELFERNVKNE